MAMADSKGGRGNGGLLIVVVLAVLSALAIWFVEGERPRMEEARVAATRTQIIVARREATAQSRQIATTQARQTATTRARQTATTRARQTATTRARQTATTRARQTATARARQTATAIAFEHPDIWLRVLDDQGAEKLYIEAQSNLRLNGRLEIAIYDDGKYEKRHSW